MSKLVNLDTTSCFFVLADDNIALQCCEEINKDTSSSSGKILVLADFLQLTKTLSARLNDRRPQNSPGYLNTSKCH